MREFLLTVRADSGTYDFIASDSSTPPDWSRVENSPAKLSRTFVTGQPREIYFSLTDAFSPANARTATADGYLINAATENEAERLKSIGFMGPATQYYVHAYKEGVPMSRSGAITTMDYPTSFPQTSSAEDWTNRNFPENPYRSDKAPGFVGSYSWAMGMWLSTTGESARHTIEVRRGENYYLPIRMVAPSTGTGAVGCIRSEITTLGPVDVFFNTGTSINSVKFTYPQVSQTSGALVITNKNGIQSPYYDLMSPIRQSSIESLSDTGSAAQTTADWIVGSNCYAQNPIASPMKMARRVISYRRVLE